MLKVYTNADINRDLIKNYKIAIIGFGSQGYGQAMNLRDSGCNVVLGLRQGGASDIKACDYGFKTLPIEEAAEWADIIQILIPDEIQAKVYKEQIQQHLTANKYLMFSHGFNIHYGLINPPEGVNVIMVAPKAPGHTVRSEYTAGRGVPSLVAVQKDFSGNSLDVALSYAAAIGSGETGILETTFREETETDLFGEQAVLCGGCSALIKAGFDTLVEAGYSPYMAYFEVCHELKLIVDLIYQGGISDMHYSISNNAEYGDLTRGTFLINEDVKAKMKKILEDIQSGKYATEFMSEMNSGCYNFKKLRDESENHKIEKIGKELRSIFNWSKEGKLIDRSKN